MQNKSGLNNVLRTDRKTLYIVLSIVMVLVLTLTVVYAALSITLNINGQAEVSSASWDIYLDNVKLNNQSSTTNIPTITDKTTASFSTTLNKPGDFYEFSIDVVNNGSIDAMIDSVTKTPELSDTQKKYLNYIVEYQNGEVITAKQLVSKNSFVRLKVKVEFKKDISASDLPTQSETLDLAFTVNYTQADETGTGVPNNGKEPFKPTIISGDLNTVGSEVAIGDEHFYIISNTDGKIAMLSKYNLYVGNECTSSSSSSCTPYGEEATGIQDETMKGLVSNQQSRNGTTPFSSTNYWSSTVSSYPAYVYDSNSTLYNYVESYRTYLESQGAEIEEARLIKYEELEALGCSVSNCSCKSAPEWVYGTTYWSGVAFDSSNVWSVHSDDDFYEGYYSSNYSRGVRPVIVLKSLV